MGRSDSSRPIPLPRISRRGVLLRGACSLWPTAPSIAVRSAWSGSPLDQRGVRSRGGRPPRFLGIPRARAPLYDLGGTSVPDHSARRCGLPRLSKRRLPRNETFEAQSRGPRSPCVRFTSTVTRRGATLGSGWWSTLAGRDWFPQGCKGDFDCYVISLPSRLGLAHNRSSYGMPQRPSTTENALREAAERRTSSRRSES